jgi:hypothetical protein
METFIRHDGLIVLAGSIAGLLLAPRANPFAVVALVAAMHGYSYWAHRALHLFPNFHLFFHHQKRGHAAVQYVAEWIMNLLPFLLPYLLLPAIYRPIVVFSAFLYTSVHMINYTLFHAGNHAAHHANPDVHFGPDAMDRLHGTSTSPPENMAHVLPNVVGAYLVARVC